MRAAFTARWLSIAFDGFAFDLAEISPSVPNTADAAVGADFNARPIAMTAVAGLNCASVYRLCCDFADSGSDAAHYIAYYPHGSYASSPTPILAPFTQLITTVMRVDDALVSFRLFSGRRWLSAVEALLFVAGKRAFSSTISGCTARRWRVDGARLSRWLDGFLLPPRAAKATPGGDASGHGRRLI